MIETKKVALVRYVGKASKKRLEKDAGGNDIPLRVGESSNAYPDPLLGILFPKKDQEGREYAIWVAVSLRSLYSTDTDAHIVTIC